MNSKVDWDFEGKTTAECAAIANDRRIAESARRKLVDESNAAHSMMIALQKQFERWELDPPADDFDHPSITVEPHGNFGQLRWKLTDTVDLLIVREGTGHEPNNMTYIEGPCSDCGQRIKTKLHNLAQMGEFIAEPVGYMHDCASYVKSEVEDMGEKPEPEPVMLPLSHSEIQSQAIVSIAGSLSRLVEVFEAGLVAIIEHDPME